MQKGNINLTDLTMQNPIKAEARKIEFYNKVLKELNFLHFSSQDLVKHYLKFEDDRLFEKIQDRFKQIITEQKTDCNDNFRVAIVGNELLEYMYEKERKSGCCGSHDEEYKIGEFVFRLGFNYGH